MSAGKIMFGSVGLEVDTAQGHCTVHVCRDGPVGPVPHCFRLNGLEEIDGVLHAWACQAGTKAKNMRAALQHAGHALRRAGGAK